MIFACLFCGVTTLYDLLYFISCLRYKKKSSAVYAGALLLVSVLALYFVVANF